MSALEVRPTSNTGLISAGSREVAGKGKAGIPFAQYLKDAMKEANNLILESERLADDFAAGRTDNIHQVLIAAEKADIALQFTMQIRNKILDAYNEIMRMQI
jgi:flagellar hook-basal body complex protein FliE